MSDSLGIVWQAKALSAGADAISEGFLFAFAVRRPKHPSRFSNVPHGGTTLMAHCESRSGSQHGSTSTPLRKARSETPRLQTRQHQGLAIYLRPG